MFINIIAFWVAVILHFRVAFELICLHWQYKVVRTDQSRQFYAFPGHQLNIQRTVVHYLAVAVLCIPPINHYYELRLRSTLMYIIHRHLVHCNYNLQW